MNEEYTTYKRAMRITIVGIVVLAIAAAVVGPLVAGWAGLAAAELGVLIAALAGLTTQAAMVMSHQKPATTMAAYVGGSWLVKMLIIVIALIVLQNIEGFNKGLFAGFMLVGVLGTLAIDFWVVRQARIPYVDSGSN
ncbi:hypothetical protein [Demequina sediminicola]|uniref:hypothetical protein n=1 Tax=Demequina sediminicola TaxID=1095026 RepID=UPI000780909C|nr:hypothetical protein [Demequina sediminicola]